MFHKYDSVKLDSYEEFVKIIEEVGFMPLSNNSIGFINLSGLTQEEQWHTNLPTDPWKWRIRIEEEHKAAYGRFFDKKPGFISLEWYEILLAAKRRRRNFEEMFFEGLVSREAKRIYELLEQHDIMAVHELKSLCGITKESNSRFERALADLQMAMFITINGTKRKISSKGEVYGWPSTAYSTVEKWAGEELMERAEKIDPIEAMKVIEERITDILPDANSAKIRRFIGY